MMAANFGEFGAWVFWTKQEAEAASFAAEKSSSTDLLFPMTG